MRKVIPSIHVVFSGGLDALGLGRVTFTTGLYVTLKRILKVACLMKYFTPFPQVDNRLYFSVLPQYIVSVAICWKNWSL